MSKINKELIELCEKEYRDRSFIIPMGRICNDNEPIYMDFTKISGIFIAGATGTGKSVLIDDLIHCFIYKNNSYDVKFCLIDPKKIELNEYNGLDYVIGGKSESDIVKIGNLLGSINKTIDERINQYETSLEVKWPHLFVIIDEGYDVYQISSNKEVLDRILNIGSKYNVHLIFATNSYLREYKNDGFLYRFKYRISFDLASIEQSKLIGINGSSWLSANGEALISGINHIPYKFQAMCVSDDEIKDIVLYSKKTN